MPGSWKIERLTPAHAEAYREMMLQAYADRPHAFTATVPEREPLPLEWWTRRVSDDPDAAQLVLGAFDGDRLVGVAGLGREQRERTKHKATLFGMTVLPEHRERGIARALVEAALERARATPGIRAVQLTVLESNLPAIRLYESCGFERFGTEPRAIRIGDDFVPLVHMWCPVGPEAK